jgi:hypothetical protein
VLCSPADVYGVTPYAGAGAGSMEVVKQQTARARAMGLRRPRTVLVEQQSTGYVVFGHSWCLTNVANAVPPQLPPISSGPDGR